MNVNDYLSTRFSVANITANELSTRLCVFDGFKTFLRVKLGRWGMGVKHRENKNDGSVESHTDLSMYIKGRYSST